jgi:hypothetical protein
MRVPADAEAVAPADDGLNATTGGRHMSMLTETEKAYDLFGNRREGVAKAAITP